MYRLRIVAIVLLALSLTLGCQSKEESGDETAQAEQVAEPDFVTVQHILIAYKGSIPGKKIARTQDAARELAGKVLEMAKSGKDFGELVKEFSDDAYPGIYKMANFGVPSGDDRRSRPRSRMVAAFGDVGFKLKVGEVGLAEYDRQKSPYGWHVIKRIE
jgi:parvulin-like peptidyl-prolyl isomerase